MDTPDIRTSTGPFDYGRSLAVLRNRRRQRAFTLIEVVISAGLIGFLAVTATYFWVDSFGLVRTVNIDSAAIADGRALLERLAREIREVKFNPSSGAYCISTMSATQMVFNKTSGDVVVGACGGALPTSTTHDIAVTIQVSAPSLNLGYYDGTLTPPATSSALTTYVAPSSVGVTQMTYLDAAYNVTASPSALRFVKVTLWLQPPGVQATGTSTVVALRNQ